MLKIILHDWEDVDSMIEMLQQIGHHFPCQCESEDEIENQTKLEEFGDNAR